MDTTNKPIAWMYRIKDTDNRWELAWNKPTTEELFDTEPLYTHPVKELMMVLDGNRVYSVFKELTDEEIRAEWYNNCGKDDWFMDFARAILKKAQEK